MSNELFFTVFIVLTISTSRQQDSTESLNDTLDRLIQQTNKGNSVKNYSDFHNRKNNSKIIFLNAPESHKQSEKDDEAKEPDTHIDDGNLLSITDILHALGLRDPKSEADVDKTKKIKEVSFTIENSKTTNTETETTEVLKLLEQLASRSGSPAEEDDSSAGAIAENDLNLLHKYPEIIIDKITYHGNKNQAGKVTENKAESGKQHVDQAAKNQNSLKIAQELKSLLEELKKIKAETASQTDIPRSNHYNVAQVTDTPDPVLQPCGNAIVQYSSPCKSVLLDKITDYQARSNGPGLDASLQLNIWRAQDARQNALMRISRAQKLKRIQFITQLINNMMSRFVYRPLYGYL